MSVGYLKDGKYYSVAKNFDIMNSPEATDEKAGLMSASDKKKLDDLVTTEVASKDTIESLFD